MKSMKREDRLEKKRGNVCVFCAFVLLHFELKKAVDMRTIACSVPHSWPFSYFIF